MTYKLRKKYLDFIIFMLLLIIMLSVIMDFNPYVIISLSTVILMMIIYTFRIENIRETTLCLMVKNDKVLMMLRNKKQNDVFLNKYNGLGGKVEKGESKEACILREVYEEAGIRLTKYDYVGKVFFQNFGYKKGKEVMYCFVGYEYENDIGECNEGELQWIPVDQVMNLPLWEGDQYFLMHIIKNQPFEAFLHYDNDQVIGHKIKFKKGEGNGSR